MTEETFRTPEEVKDYHHVDLRTACRPAKAGRLPAVGIGRQSRFSRHDSDASRRAQRPGSGPRRAAPVRAGIGRIPNIGVSSYVTKPFRASQVVAAVARALGGR